MSNYLTHVTKNNERFDRLAYHYYGNCFQILPIFEANRGLFVENLDPLYDVLPVGLTLKIPFLEAKTLDESLLPPWKRGKA